ncbi:nudC domain-containing protein 1 [Neocloeon triangulifer]|uniref:nudC domain-containing protein 1 n=1 Tax=Neocloeon triangulifer TaxID=2078957 RepID=UPI00286FA391|nr:nudC domain-containing protein 1 [Neocloeon triangulifer]
MPVLSELSPDTSLLTPDFEGYKLSLDKVPIFKHEISGGGVNHLEPSSDQFSFLFVRLFGLHNHLHGDPWTKGHVYFFNENGEIVKNVWDTDKRSFESSVVATSSFNKPVSGDLNPTICLDTPKHAAVMDGASGGLVRIFTTGDRNSNESWQEVASFKIDVVGVLKGLVSNQESNEIHVLIESVVHSESIPELKYQDEDQPSESATLIHWLTVNPTLGKGEDCIVSKRKICVHGVVEYVALEEGGQAVYVASHKEAFFTYDSNRPCTPPIERALREPINYTWDQTENEVFVTFSIHSAIDKKCLDVEIDEEERKLKITIKGPEHSKVVIDGVLAQGITKDFEVSVVDGRAEIRLNKKEADQTWEEFIADDPHGAKAPHPEEITKAAAGLEKFTSEDKMDDENINQGFNAGQLEECDSEAVSARLVRLPLTSHSPSHTVLLSGHQWIGACRPPPPGLPALLLRHDVDALVWQPNEPKDSTWTLSHLSTFPGFGYVQASKTSRKWVVCPSALGWVAVVDSQQHIYLYHQPQPLQTQLVNRKSGQKVKTVARQQVVSLPDNTARILGVYPEDDKLFVLHKNSILVLSMNQNQD